MNIKNMFKQLIYPRAKDLDARKHEELTAMLVLKYLKKFDTNLQAVQLDMLYEDNFSIPQKVQDEVSAVLNTLTKMSKDLPNNFTKRLSKGSFHAVCDAVQIAFATGYSIKNPKEYLRWFLTMNAELVTAAKQLTEEEKEQSWIEWMRMYYIGHNYNKSRQLISDKLAGDLNKLVTNGVLLKKRTYKDCFNQGDIALHLWVDQGHKDRNDNDIDILDIYLGKTHVDHVKSVRDGGTTTYDNAELMTAIDNLKKGASSNEPYFEHQKMNPMDELTKSICNPEYVFSEDETLDESE
jgi:hypothetical protein